jgi:DNA-binding transcriptional LysR family regulator
VRLEYLHPHRVYEAVEGDTADLGIVSYPKASRTMRAIRWRIEPMALVCSPRHRLAGRDRVSLDELHGENVVNFDSDLTIRREIDAVLQAHGVEVRVAMEFDNIETIKRAIEIDAGIGLLPIPTVMREADAGTLVVVPLATDELVRPLGIIFRRGKEQSSTTRRFMELLQAQESVSSLELIDGATDGVNNGVDHDSHIGNSALSVDGAAGAEQFVPVAVACDNGSS